ncbi:MAG TPA: hypothetical protein VN181_03090 [Thermoanaerobaculia bacterium]|nr:hypothetical protein [Thermoanaerobaculia bacterium]
MNGVIRRWAAALAGSHDSDEHVLAFIDFSDAEAVKVDGANGLVGRFDADALASEWLGKKDPMIAPLDVAALADRSLLEVRRVLRFVPRAGKRTR